MAAILLECADHVGALVASIAAENDIDPATVVMGSHILARLTAQTDFVPAADAGHTPVSAPVAEVPAAIDGARVAADGWHISVRFSENVLKNGMDPLSFIRYLTTFGSITGLQVVDRTPALERFDAECCYLGFEIAFRTGADKSRIEAAFEFVRDDCELQVLAPHSQAADFAALIAHRQETEEQVGGLLMGCGTLTEQELTMCLGLGAGHGEPPQVSPRGQSAAPSVTIHPSVVDAAQPQAGEARAPKDAKAEGHSIRVDGDKLDRLIDWIGELIIAGAATGSIARQAGLPVLQESAQQLAYIVGEVRDQALKLRMVQIGSTFSKFPRVVRDVARESGKDIELEVSGAETELDRTLVEGIADPLTHLVRNAIDHGIETPEVRRAQGKAATGVVRLNAYHDAGSVVIEVSDDGGGLKKDRIIQKATERGLIAAGQSMSDEQVFALIFEAGFSTAEKVTNLSGRGVGMDVVKRNITALRGTVVVHSEAGQGTRVSIRLPLTLAIIDGFQVGVGQSHFVIPLDLVEECVEIDAGEDGDAGAPGHISSHGSLLPLIRLRDMFGIRHATGGRQSVVVVRSAGERVGIVVDDLLGELQAVIKPLSRLFSELRGIGGSTILGNGKVALILDIPGLIERTHDMNRSADEAQRLRTRVREMVCS
jgi:two-component system chemotaxis sensor kinase CheA